MELLPLDIIKLIAKYLDLTDINHLSRLSKSLFSKFRNKDIIRNLKNGYTIINVLGITNELRIKTQKFYKCNNCSQIEGYSDLLYKTCDYCGQNVCKRNISTVYNPRPDVMDCFYEICDECEAEKI